MPGLLGANTHAAALVDVEVVVMDVVMALKVVLQSVVGKGEKVPMGQVVGAPIVVVHRLLRVVLRGMGENMRRKGRSRSQRRPKTKRLPTISLFLTQMCG